MPKDFAGQEPTGWFTAKGVHIPIYEGETPDEALKRVQRDQIMDTAKTNTPFKSFGFNTDNAYKEASKFFSDDNNSNFENWNESLTRDELYELKYYTDDDGSYKYINKDLNKIGYKNLDSMTKEEVDNMDNAIGKFELYEPIRVTRQADMRMLGFDKTSSPSKSDIINKLIQTGGYMEYPAYLSSSCDEYGRDVNSCSLVVHIGVKPSRGAGCYVGHSKLSSVPDENEFLFARNSVLRYNLSTLKIVNGVYEINAEWVAKIDDK